MSPVNGLQDGPPAEAVSTPLFQEGPEAELISDLVTTTAATALEYWGEWVES